MLRHILLIPALVRQLFSYIFIENNNTKKKEGKKEFGRPRTQHHRLAATTPHHYTTETGYVIQGKVFNLIPFP